MNTQSQRLIDPLTITIPLTNEAHHQAKIFHSEQLNSPKAKQVYLNTLAVYAVNFYLTCLGIATNLAASDSWNSLTQTLTDTADLIVEGRGKLECRPVLPQQQFCYVPPEVQQERIGYVAVRLNHALTQATLMGFVPTVAGEQICLENLRNLDDLLTHLDTSEQPNKARVTKLSQWLCGISDSGWQNVEDLWAQILPMEPVFSFRSPSKETMKALESKILGAKRRRMLDFDVDGVTVLLCVGLVPETSWEMNILVEIYPLGGKPYLPENLQLEILDETGEVVMDAIAKSNHDLEFEFSGEPGENFSVKVTLGDISITEPFVI